MTAHDEQLGLTQTTAAATDATGRRPQGLGGGAAERIARLQQVSAALGAAVTPDAVGAVIVREGMAAVGAAAAAIFTLDPAANQFELLSRADEPARAAQPWWLGQPEPLREAREARAVVTVEGAIELGRRWPGLAGGEPRRGEAAVAVPLLLDDQVLGVCCLIFDGPHHFTPEERALLLAMGQQGAQALERARLYAAERRARLAAEQTAARTERLYVVTTALAEALTLSEVAAVIVTQGMAALGASSGSVRQLSADGTALEALNVVGYPPALAALWQTLPLDAPVPMAEAVRTARPILIESPEVLAAEWPQLTAAMQALHYQATALLPLMVRGEPIGTLSLGFAAPRRFDADERDFLVALARQCALALERARLYAATQAQAARLGALAEASQIFAAASLDLPALLEAVARQVTQAVGDLGVVGLLSDDRRLLRLAAIAHANPEARAAMARLLEAFPLGVSEGFSRKTLETGEAQILPVITPAQLRALLKPEYHPYLERFGICSLMVAALRVNGEVIGTLGALRDTPGRPYTADDLTTLQELADRAALAVANARLYQRAQEAIQVRDQFLSIAAHELKTPLTSLYGQAQLAQRRLGRGEQSPERMARSIELIARQAERLDAMVVALLDVGRLEHGQFVIERRPVDLGELARRVVDEARPDLEQHALRLECDPAPLVVLGDPGRLEQVLQNLLSNAIKYSPGGGPIRVRIERRGDHAAVSVADQGVGIPGAAMPHLFQRFYRAPNATAHHISGMGIGLYVVREIVGLHGGSVEVASSEGAGSTFTVVLPLAPAATAGEAS